ncbi:hypothetical protein DY000_02017756 [Brassica cretica]|uniref:F-box domain-containing protein n=2 Tax=Brassica cretica TaxID=69181 RepID=A0ABQ7DBB8_BRACR|nr:hypothetical protein DY000_02017756 [Brassica cretica]
MSNYEEQPRAKKTKREAFRLSCLPDDLVMNCLARVSRPDLAALSMVSKRYHSLVASPDLYKIRSLIGRTETYVYVCLRIPTPVPSVRWYILRRRKTLDASDLIQIPSLPSQPLEASSVVVLDCSIYVIGGLIKGEQRSSDVWSLDCRTHVWHPVPSMGAARAYGAAGVVDGKIYVFGGCDVDDNYGEVFDPEIQTWNPLPPMPKRKKHIHSSMVRDQKVYALDEKERTFYYSPREGKWGTGNRGQLAGYRRDWCMVDNLLFCLSKNGVILWCEPGELDLRETERVMNVEVVRGFTYRSLYQNLFLSRLVHYGDQIIDRWEEKWIMDGRPPFKIPKCWKKFRFERLRPGARMCSSGGKIVLFWDKISLEGYLHHIWWAEISLDRLQGGEIWGYIERSNIVMPVEPVKAHKKVLHSVSVTL